MNNEQKYVVGIVFSNDREHVALIRKQKPVWQKGKLNGVGGKVEQNEFAINAMEREFQEETGVFIRGCEWKHFLQMMGQNDAGTGEFYIDFFTAECDLTLLKSPEEEKIEIISTREIHPLRNDVIENIPWVVALALDHITDKRPSNVIAHYLT